MNDLVPADANPEKRLFISLLTRDISLVAAFLDLLDNSVNAAIEPYSDQLSTAKGYVDLLEDTTPIQRASIGITISPTKVDVFDNAPGISLDTAQNHVFRFGRSEDQETLSDRLSVYGLELKRAFFKLGTKVHITSDHVDGGFELDLDVNEWARDATVPWTFLVLPRSRQALEECGTRITVTNLYPETSTRVEDGVFLGQLKEAIATTYAYYLTKFVDISVNGESVFPSNLRVGSNNATDGFELDDVTCTITAGLGTPEGELYRDKGSGWFVFCNGRTVISADKSRITGWNNNGLPIYQPKHRPFLGTVYFVSQHADRLPWDTTKSKINEDSAVWQRAKGLMVTVGRSVTSFLDSRYSDEGTEIVQKDLVDATKERVGAMAASIGTKKAFVQPKRPRRLNMRIQYDAKILDVESIARYLSRPGMSGSEVGRHTFHHFLRNEVGED